MWQMSAGREFQTDGPATENARSPNLVTVCGTVYENVSVEERSLSVMYLSSTCNVLLTVRVLSDMPQKDLAPFSYIYPTKNRLSMIKYELSTFCHWCFLT